MSLQKKMAPKKATKKPVVKKTMSVKTNPIEKLSQTRREFFTSLQDRLQALPDLSLLPSSLSEDVRAYSRSQGSEKGLLKAIDCPVGQWNQLLSFLLEPPNLVCSNLEPLIQKFIASLVLQDELGLAEDPLSRLSYDERIVFRVRQYVKENLSRFIADLPVDIQPTDKPITTVQKDLDKIFPVDNPFSPIFELNIPAPYIKIWLAHTDFVSHKRVDVRRAVHEFIQTHRFHMLKDLLDNGFSPRSPHDWEIVVGKDYFDRFPLPFWKATTWQQIESMNEGLQKYSLSVHDYFQLLHEKEERSKLLRVKGSKKVRGVKLDLLEEESDNAHKLKYQPAPKNLLRLPTEKEMMVNLRIRGDIPDFVSHLVQPLGDCSDYCGRNFQDNLFFPTDRFYKDRVDPTKDAVSFSHNVLVLRSSLFDPPKEFRFHVFYHLNNGQVIPQTTTLFKEEQAYLSQEKGIQLPNLKKHLLESPIESLASEDVDRIQMKLKKDLSSLLNQVFVKKMDTDKIANEMESCTNFKTLDEYLSKMFRVFLLVHPRYQFFSVFPEMKDRLNMFFYHLSSIGILPLPLLFPRIETLDESTQEVFFSWIEKATQEFKQDVLAFLLADRYPFIRLPIQSVGHTSAPVVLHDKTKDNKFLWLMPYHDHQLNICDLCSVTNHDEVIVGGKPLPAHVLEMVHNYVKCDRVKLRQGAFLEETGFELTQEEDIGLPLETPVLAVQPTPLTTQNIPGFK